jgi:hypothetical protein
MLKIQSAIDAYEKKFPRRPSPTAAEALAWQASKGKRKWNSAGRANATKDAVRSTFWQAIVGWWKRIAILQS